MKLGIDGRVAMVAAASKGIGRAVALALAREGANVSLAARGTDALESARSAAEAARSGVRAIAEPCDVSVKADLERWHARTVSELGAVDILITSTGGPPAGRFEELTEETWRAGIDSTLLNVVRLGLLVLPQMKARKWGRIVHVTSFVAKEPLPLLTLSSTLRAGVSALTKTMATELAPHAVLVNAVLPGHVMTERQTHLAEIRAREEGISVEEQLARAERLLPMGRYGRAEEIGDVVAFLASERASYLTGATIQVDGGLVKSTF
jgi:3-oxoacyl-[acyl-carrier protein] reductase